MKLSAKALEIAISQIGRGESGANNSGPWVREYRRDDKAEAWCAAFVCWCYELAWAQFFGYAKWLDAPLNLRKSCPLKRRHGAKRLCAGLQRVLNPEPGDLALWHRGAQNAATGHVGIVSKYRQETGEFWTVEGNRGAFPSKVREFGHVVGEGGFLGFYRVKE